MSDVPTAVSENEINLLKSLYDEASAWWAYYSESTGPIIDSTEVGQPLDYVYPAQREMFPIYTSNGATVSVLKTDASRRLAIQFYTKATSLLDAFATNNALRDSYFTAEAQAKEQHAHQPAWTNIRDRRFLAYRIQGGVIIELHHQTRDAFNSFVKEAGGEINLDRNPPELMEREALVLASRAMLMSSGQVAASVDKYAYWSLVAVAAGFVAVIRQLPALSDVADTRNMSVFVIWFLIAFLFCSLQRWLATIVKSGAETAEKMEPLLKGQKPFDLAVYLSEMIRAVPPITRPIVRRVYRKLAAGDLMAGGVFLARCTWVQAIFTVIELIALTVCICASVK